MSGGTGLKLGLQLRLEWHIWQVTLWAGGAQCSSTVAKKLQPTWYCISYNWSNDRLSWNENRKLWSHWWISWKAREKASAREKDRCRLGENILRLLYFCQLLQGLWWGQSTSRLFLPQEIQSTKSFSQRNAISWGHTRRQKYIELNNKNISLQSSLRRYLRLRLLTQSDQSSHNIFPRGQKDKKTTQAHWVLSGRKAFLYNGLGIFYATSLCHGWWGHI